MPVIYELGPQSVWTGSSAALADGEAAPAGWVLAAPPPSAPAGKVVCWQGGRWQAVALPCDRMLEQRLAEFAARRWDCQQSMTWQGVEAATDDTAATRLSVAIKAREMAQAAGLEAPDATASWKASAGVYLDLTLNDQRALLLAGAAHVQACFDVERIKADAAKAAHEAGDYAGIAAVDPATDWPS